MLLNTAFIEEQWKDAQKKSNYIGEHCVQSWLFVFSRRIKKMSSDMK